MKEKKLKIGIITLPLVKETMVPLSNLVEILFAITTEFVVITGNEGYKKYKSENRFRVYDVSYKIGNTFLKIIRNFYGQIKASYIIIKLRKKIDYWIIFGGEREILIIIIAKLLKKNVIILILGSAIKECSFNDDPYLKIVTLFSAMKLKLADKIIVYSPRLVTEWHLEKYRQKILVTHRHFIDTDTFRATTLFAERPLLIGYIGRLSEEKGVQQFIRALPIIFQDREDLRVFIGGDGPLIKSTETFLKEENISDRIDLIGWIPHDDLPRYLNQIRLLVLPSFSEGLPNIMLEAMACGTPILATPVGAIPDIIKDGKTGFIIKDNSPECIAKNVIRALDCPDLAKIAENGRNSVLENYTFEKTVDRWKKIFNNM